MDQIEKQFFAQTIRLIRANSVSSLSLLTGIKELKIVNPGPDKDFSSDHWISSLEIDLDVAKVSINAHFSSHTAREFCSKHLSLKKEELPVQLLPSFFEEYLNNLLGTVKAFYSAGLNKSTTPSTSPSYDVGNPLARNQEANSDTWLLQWANFEIAMTTHIQVLGDLRVLTEKDASSEEESQIVEFF